VKISNTDLPSTSSEFLEYDADKKYSEWVKWRAEALQRDL
jgi:hypothetical protein